MFNRVWALCLFFAFASSAGYCQSLDGSPYIPGKDADIDMFISSWKESMPRHSHGSLVERDILTRGNQLKPPRKGAVLEYINRFAYATLDEGDSTTPTVLEGEQEVFYTISGKGVVSAGGKSADLFEGIIFLVPEKLEFTITNTGNEPLAMYLISDPVPEGFTPRKDILVRNNETTPFNKTVGHWSYQEKDLIVGGGLATLYAVITLTLDPMTIGHPHVHGKGVEEVWTTISGQNIAFLGKQLRNQPPGTAYMIPPDGKTNHSNINPSKSEQVLMLYFAVRKDIK